MDISDLTSVQGELRRTNRKLESAVQQLRLQRDAMVQSEKLASIGQLAAGVAHEINNPISYVTSNLATIAQYVESLRSLLELYRRRDAIPDGDPRRATFDAGIRQATADGDLEFVLADIDGVLRESREGATRVAEIVQSLRSFARDDSEQMSRYDLNDCVESMVRLVWNELKYSCRVEKELGEIPPMAGRGGQINQVIMNILVNAAHAIGSDQGTITIRTRATGDVAVVEISDTGCGMSPETVSRIFEPFYTTKDVGRGTGLGLAVSHGIVADHGGRIEVESAPGAGSTFRVVLPLPASGDELLLD
jgi:signal transduction histidine kinase